MNPEVGHLFHDSHFSGGQLEAREHLKAREINAREERLRCRNDYHLERAREICEKRSEWERAKVKRQLRSILERTPTFYRSLNEEKERFRNRHQFARNDHIPTSISQPWKRQSDNLQIFLSSQTLESTRTDRWPSFKSSEGNYPTGSVDVSNVDSLELGLGLRRLKLTQPSVKLSGPREMPTKYYVLENKSSYNNKMRAHVSHYGVALGRLQQKGIADRGKKQSRVEDCADMLEDAYVRRNKEAGLRRRTNHAVMAIVRVQARKEQRRREVRAARIQLARSRVKVGTVPSTLPALPQHVLPELSPVEKSGTSAISKAMITTPSREFLPLIELPVVNGMENVNRLGTVCSLTSY